MISKIISIIMSIIAFFSSFLGIGADKKIPAGEMISYSKNGKSVYVEFSENPSTGYIWETDNYNEKVIKLSDSEIYYSPSDEGRLGASGTRIFTFDAVAPGTARVKFTYERHWEEGAVREIMIEFTVNQDLTVEACQIPCN